MIWVLSFTLTNRSDKLGLACRRLRDYDKEAWKKDCGS